MKELPIKPLGKRVLIKADEVEEKTVGGLYVPASANEDKKSETGTVLALGEVSSDKFKFKVKVNDRVYFKKYAPEEIEVNGTKYLLVDEADILAIIK